MDQQHARVIYYEKSSQKIVFPDASNNKIRFHFQCHKSNIFHVSVHQCYAPCRWVVQAMQLELNYSEEMNNAASSARETPPAREVAFLSPSEVKQLLLRLLTRLPEGKDYR